MDDSKTSTSANNAKNAPGARPKRRLRIPIAFKLIPVTVILMAAVGSLIAVQNSDTFAGNATSRERDNTRDQAHTRAMALETQIQGLIDDMKSLATALTRSQGQVRKNVSQLIFHRNDDFVSFSMYQRQSNGRLQAVDRLIDQAYLDSFQLDQEYIIQLRRQLQFPLEAIFASSEDNPVIEVRNSSTENGPPLVTIGLPYATDETGLVTHVAVADFRLEKFQKIFLVNTRTIYAIDKEGALIAHPKDQLTIARKSMTDSSIVKKALQSKLRQGATRFQDDIDGSYHIGAFAKTSFGVSVISQAPESIILEDARIIRHEAFGITAMVLSVALFFIMVFAMILTSPIERLDLVAQEIAKGNFKVKTGVKSRDELGELAETIDDMVVGLIERDKAKTLINKFHGSTVAEDMMKGEIELKGEKKHVTVFFSDIRDFTKFSEGHSPEEVVEMLNEYFHVMVEIVNRNNGMVDKFIGDAIMAVWGTQTEDADEHRALQACLEMRMALEQLNQSRLERGLTEIKIGIGLHCGQAISGTIGSNERMEYTVIGDTVNMAARIEASTKAFGTDLLISNATEDLVKNAFWTEQAGSAEVKGKAEALKLFKVRGFIKDGQKVELRTKYSDYDKGQDAKVKVA